MCHVCSPVQCHASRVSKHVRVCVCVCVTCVCVLRVCVRYVCVGPRFSGALERVYAGLNQEKIKVYVCVCVCLRPHSVPGIALGRCVYPCACLAVCPMCVSVPGVG